MRSKNFISIVMAIVTALLLVPEVSGNAAEKRTKYDMSYNDQSYYVLKSLDSISVKAAPEIHSKRIGKISKGQQITVKFVAKDERYVWGALAGGAYIALCDRLDSNFFEIQSEQSVFFPTGLYKAIYNVSKKALPDVSSKRLGRVSAGADIEIIRVINGTDGYVWGEAYDNDNNVFYTALAESNGENYYELMISQERTDTVKKQKYDRTKAIEWVRRYFPYKYYLCAGSVSQSLYIGGLEGFGNISNTIPGGVEAKYRNCKGLYDALTKNGLATCEEAIFNKDNKVMNQNCEPGDVLLVKSPNTYYHVAVITSVEDGYVSYSQTNPLREDKLLKSTWAVNGWGKDAKTYILHITY